VQLTYLRLGGYDEVLAISGEGFSVPSYGGDGSVENFASGRHVTTYSMFSNLHVGILFGGRRFVIGSRPKHFFDDSQFTLESKISRKKLISVAVFCESNA
jgi:hypothetical protein